MALLPPLTVTPTLACSSCGARITVQVTCRPLPAEAGTIAMRVTTSRDDQAWLALFEQAHAGPIVRAS
jgi:hypothetical protein